MAERRTDQPLISFSSGPLTNYLQCSICLDVFTDPVSTPCGHNFCKTCLNKCWDNSQTCSCPYCKETFRQRPDLKINTTLREISEHYKEKKEDYICQEHDRPLELFCRDDQTRMCSMCDLTDHRNHNTVPIEEEIKKKKDVQQTMPKITHLKWMQQYAVDVTLDPDTAQPELILSDDGKQVRHGDIRQKLPDKPQRFEIFTIVLGKKGFSSGRFYFEVQVNGKSDWDLGVARESIYRKRFITGGPISGYWTLILRNGNEYSTSHGVSLSLRVKPQCVGVFVDYEEGLVSFYDVESGSLIYSFTGQTFTGKIYPFLNPCLNDRGRNSTPLIIKPVITK